MSIITDAHAGKQSLGELWSSIQKLSYHIVRDNNLLQDAEYPIVVRAAQVHTLKVLLAEIESHNPSESWDIK